MWLWFHRIFRKFRHRKDAALWCIFGLFLVSVFGNALCFYFFDGQARKDLKFSDALWYSIISVTTIGYGDLSAQTFGARLGTVVFTIVVGLGTFGVLTGMVIDWVTRETQMGARGMSTPVVDQHVLIVNFPNEQRVRHLIDEIRSDPSDSEREIVLVADTLEVCPIDLESVFFVRGSVLDQSTYARASIARAARAIVLATSYDDPSSDAVVSSAVAVIESMNRQIRTVAECLSAAHTPLFGSVQCDAIVCSMDISGKLLVQEAQDPGVGKVIDMITSNKTSTTIFSTTVTTLRKDTYRALATRLFGQGVALLGVNRGADTFAPRTLDTVSPQVGDQVIYVGESRLPWEVMAGVG